MCHEWHAWKRGGGVDFLDRLNVMRARIANPPRRAETEQRAHFLARGPAPPELLEDFRDEEEAVLSEAARGRPSRTLGRSQSRILDPSSVMLDRSGGGAAGAKDGVPTSPQHRLVYVARKILVTVRSCTIGRVCVSGGSFV
jgi:hypothetical protein